MIWIIIIICIILVVSYISKNNNQSSEPHSNYDQNHKSNNQGFQSSNLNINLGKFNHYLEPNEKCSFYQDDVAWYKYDTRENIWDVKAAGTLYLTNYKLILYDKGFSNIWTKLSVEGDFSEQIYFFQLDNIVDVKQMNLNTGLRGIHISATNDQCILAPSQRNYSGRVTPIVNEYSSLVELGERLIILNSSSEIERLANEVKELERERLETKKKYNL